MGAAFDALGGEARLAVEWKSRQNLNMALADGNQMAMANQQKFLGNNRESLANNPESLRQIIREYKASMASHHDD